jgi:uncharacterized integral membrane protein
MRGIYMAAITIFALAILTFALQNIEMVTMSFLGFSARVPLALLVIVIYVAGAFTGGGLGALLRHSLKGSGIVAPK